MFEVVLYPVCLVFFQNLGSRSLRDWKLVTREVFVEFRKALVLYTVSIDEKFWKPGGEDVRAFSLGLYWKAASKTNETSIGISGRRWFLIDEVALEFWWIWFGFGRFGLRIVSRLVIQNPSDKQAGAYLEENFALQIFRTRQVHKFFNQRRGNQHITKNFL